MSINGYGYINILISLPSPISNSDLIRKPLLQRAAQK
jgi:hypothetical protein